MSLSVLHYSGLSLISLLDSLSGSYSTVNLSSFPETETVCQSFCLLFSQISPMKRASSTATFRKTPSSSPTSKEQWGHWMGHTSMHDLQFRIIHIITTARASSLLQVSALHYSTRSQSSDGV